MSEPWSIGSGTSCASRLAVITKERLRLQWLTVCTIM